MRYKDITFFTQILKAKLSRSKRPLLVSWALTSRCNCRCFYCSEFKNNYSELETDQIFRLIDGFKKLGTKKIHYTGGEPLLRKDFISIVEYTWSRKISVSLSTNGILLKDKIDLLKGKIESVNLNFDGPEACHNKVKGQGAHKNLLETMRMLNDNKVEIILTMTLRNDNANIDFVKYALDIAANFGAKVIFQPAVDYSDSQGWPAEFSPEKFHYAQVMDYILKRKKKYNENTIFSSVKTLEFLKNWPNAISLKNCPAGIISCRLTPDGRLSLCGWKTKGEVINDTESVLSLKKEFMRLSQRSNGCKQCWCAPRVEFASLWALDLQAIMNMAVKNHKVVK